jgi:hypothetical protein
LNAVFLCVWKDINVPHIFLEQTDEKVNADPVVNRKAKLELVVVLALSFVLSSKKLVDHEEKILYTMVYPVPVRICTQ